MRILVDLKSHVTGSPVVTQVEKVPPPGVGVAINGKYVLPILTGAEFPVDSTSYILHGAGEIDGGDLSSISFAHLLAMYPGFGHIYFNPLLTADNVGELDFTKEFIDQSLDPVATFTPRLQTGREPGDDEGQMPTHTALLAANSAMDPARPGLIISDLIDIGPYTLDSQGNEVGTDEFMLYWKILGFSVSDDVAADYGALADTNTPAIRQVTEVDQEPDGFSAYISPDDGANWCEVGLLEPVAFVEKTTQIRVAFKNTSSSKVFLAHFAVLF